MELLKDLNDSLEKEMSSLKKQHLDNVFDTWNYLSEIKVGFFYQTGRLMLTQIVSPELSWNINHPFGKTKKKFHFHFFKLKINFSSHKVFSMKKDQHF